MPRRSRLEMFAEILKTAKDGAKKTRIMYQCYLSYYQTEKFLEHLLEIGLLSRGNSFHTTDKGLEFLEAYHSLELLLSPRN